MGNSKSSYFCEHLNDVQLFKKALIKAKFFSPSNDLVNVLSKIKAAWLLSPMTKGHDTKVQMGYYNMLSVRVNLPAKIRTKRQGKANI